MQSMMQFLAILRKRFHTASRGRGFILGHLVIPMLTALSEWGLFPLLSPLSGHCKNVGRVQRSTSGETQAEKVCGSKAVHAAKGYYNDLDAAISYHPLWLNSAIRDVTNCLYWSAVFTFQCTESEPWVRGLVDNPAAGSHNDVRSPGALDAVTLMVTATKYTKENMYPRTGFWSLNEALLPSGQATSDNLPPRFAQIQYSWRSPLMEIQEQILSVLQRNARHAAGLANCDVSMRWVTKTRPGLPNHVMTDACTGTWAL